MSDKNVSCPHRRYARAASAAGYDLRLARFTAVLPEEVRRGYGAYHTTDFVYMFRHAETGAFQATADDVATQDVMTALWGAFAATGEPATAAMAWPRYDASTDQSLLVQAAPEVASGIKRDDCDMWDRFTPP